MSHCKDDPRHSDLMLAARCWHQKSPCWSQKADFLSMTKNGRMHPDTSADCLWRLLTSWWYCLGWVESCPKDKSSSQANHDMPRNMSLQVPFVPVAPIIIAVYYSNILWQYIIAVYYSSILVCIANQGSTPNEQLMSSACPWSPLHFQLTSSCTLLSRCMYTVSVGVQKKKKDFTHCLPASALTHKHDSPSLVIFGHIKMRLSYTFDAGVTDWLPECVLLLHASPHCQSWSMGVNVAAFVTSQHKTCKAVLRAQPWQRLISTSTHEQKSTDSENAKLNAYYVQQAMDRSFEMSKSCTRKVGDFCHDNCMQQQRLQMCVYIAAHAAPRRMCAQLPGTLPTQSTSDTYCGLPAVWSSTSGLMMWPL